MPYIIGLDVETAKIPNHLPWKDGFYLSTVSLSLPSGVSMSWMFHHDTLENVDYDKNFREIQKVIDTADYVSAHNAKFDVSVLRDKLIFPKLWCTQVAQYLLQYQIQKRNLKLNDLCPQYGLSLKLDKVKAMWDAGYDTAEIPVSLLTEYCEDDATKCRKIAEQQYFKLQGRGLMKCFDLQMEWLDMLSEMECQGVGWDNDRAINILSKYRRYSAILDQLILKKVEPYVNGQVLNLGSKEDLSALLYGGVLTRREKIPVIKTKNIKVKMPYVFTYADGTKKIKTKWKQHPDTKYIQMVYGERRYKITGLALKPLPKTELDKHTEERPLYFTDKDTLPGLKIETPIQNVIIKMLLRKSSIDKVCSTFSNATGKTGLLTKIARDGKLHTNYNQAVTATGRLSSSDPNSQNLPRGNTSPIKTCIVPTLDGIMNADLSQIEWRVPAQLSGDPTMIAEIVDGVDQHVAAATDLMGLPFISKKDPASKKNRDHAKVFNFRMIYGGTEWGFFKDPKMPSFKIKRWKEVIDAFFAKYSGLKQWHDRNIAHVINGDGTLVLPTGRAYRFSTKWQGKYNEREIKNYPVQGLAGGDILPLAAVMIRKAMRKRNMKSRAILTVHDSIVFDYLESEKKALAKLCLHVFNNLHLYIKAYWGFDWVVPLTGEVDIGPNYGAMKGYM